MYWHILVNLIATSLNSIGFDGYVPIWRLLEGIVIGFFVIWPLPREFCNATNQTRALLAFRWDWYSWRILVKNFFSETLSMRISCVLRVNWFKKTLKLKKKKKIFMKNSFLMLMYHILLLWYFAYRNRPFLRF